MPKLEHDWELPAPQGEQRNRDGLAVVDERAQEIEEFATGGVVPITPPLRNSCGLIIEPDPDCDACQ